MKNMLQIIRQVCITCLLLSTLPGIAIATEHKAGSANSDTVIMLHGLGRSAFSMWLLEKRLTSAGFRVHNLDYPSRDLPPEALLEHITKLIDECCGSIQGKVHFVGHSLGALLIRAYLHDKPRIQPARVVLLGPPNNGSELVDSFGQTRWFEILLGPTAQQLGTQGQNFPQSLSAPDYELGIIAGNHSINPLGSWIIPGEDDGMVSIKSTRIEGMSDFLILPTDHVLMRYDREVSDQTVHFLKTGHFKRDENE
jgi:pimeloyl-ACP methyl ester carboxylesterase